MISLLSHFGSRYSYATVASRIAGRLARDERLGPIMNLDDEALPEHRGVFRACRPAGVDSPLLALTAPGPLFETIFSGYKNVGLFVSPNTSQLSREHVEVLDRCRVAFAPSGYCAEVVQRFSRTPVVVCPIGVPDAYAERHREGSRLDRPFTYLHLTTDFFLPGRKGTQEVVAAWAAVRSLVPGARLVVHAPARVSTEIYYDLAEQERKDGDYGRFEVLSPPLRGMSEADLADLICSADVVVLPSRCEGFGMIILAALVLGVPLVTTDVTGQRDFLRDFEERPNAYGQPFITAPTLGEGPLCGEDGPAPLIDVEGLAESMLLAHRQHDRLRAAVVGVPQAHRQKWTWSSVLDGWAKQLEKWEIAK